MSHRGGGMGSFIGLVLVGVGSMVMLYLALPMLHFSGIAAINSTDAGSTARVIAVNQTDMFGFLVGTLGWGLIVVIGLFIVVAAVVMAYYAGRRR